MLPNHRFHARSIQRRASQLKLPIEEKRHAVAMLSVAVDHTVTCATVVSSRVLLHHVANVDNVRSLDDGDGDPALGGRVPDLETLAGWFLEEDGDTAEIGVITDYHPSQLLSSP